MNRYRPSRGFETSGLGFPGAKATRLHDVVPTGTKKFKINLNNAIQRSREMPENHGSNFRSNLA
ncbi:MAG: hypothetical protein COA78_01430 [Blastopirellula sp.]|nr:MAG: hypothetical protein COA78_01430 [Blastopirellula sp.]